MHLQRLAKRTGFADKYDAALTQGTSDRFDDAGAAASFGTAPVLPAGQCADIRFPAVGEGPAVAVVTAGQGLLQPPGRVALAQHPGHDAPAGPFDGQPKPDFALFAAHEGPHLLKFKRLPPLALRPFWPQPGQRRRVRQGFFYPARHRHADHASHAPDAALGVALQQEPVDLRVLRGLVHGRRHKPGLVPTRLARVLGMALAATVASNLFTATCGTQMSRRNHTQNYTAHPKLDHRLKILLRFK